MDLLQYRKELDAYYSPLKQAVLDQNQRFVQFRERIYHDMDEYALCHPNLPAAALKAELHARIAARFEPVIFRHSPFFFEMGLRPAENWGTPDRMPAAWLLSRRIGRITEDPLFRNIAGFSKEAGGLGLAEWVSVFDADHHSLGITRLLKTGVNGLLEEIRSEKVGAGGEKRAFLDAAEKSCESVIQIANKFAEKAEEMLSARQTRRQPETEYLRMIAAAARHVPAQPPRTFYEGLAMLWFLREVTASIEGIGISVIGSPDRQLIELYRADRASGRLSEDEARDLVACWMLPTESKFHVDDSSWPETSTCIELGGCDQAGRPLYNELTRLFIEAHESHHFLNPKLNCRISADAPTEYLEQIGGSILRGHNNFALLNDDILVPAIIRSGKSPEEARRYVNGGCQETIVEGVEHSAGAYYYFNMAGALDLCLQPPQAGEGLLKRYDGGSGTSGVVPTVIRDAHDFAAYYRQFFEEMTRAISAGAEWRRMLGSAWHEIHPCPFFSSTLDGCIQVGRDYTAGGAKYNPSTVAAVGLATVVDSLYAIKKGVYDEKWLSLAELREALTCNWVGQEQLRRKMIRLPKFGQGNEEVDCLAERFCAEFAGFVRGLRNERGGYYQPSLFVYYAFASFAPFVRATPDGRHAGDPLSQGIAPGRLSASRSITDVFHSISQIDFRDYPANAVLDIQLPAGNGIEPTIIASLARAFSRMGGPTLQINRVCVEDLKDAKIHPERHQDLVVRICGLSAHFVRLEPGVQDEIIERTMFSLG